MWRDRLSKTCVVIIQYYLHKFQYSSFHFCSNFFGSCQLVSEHRPGALLPTMVTTRSNPENPDTMERILEMLMADRQNREVERQQFETRFARLEAMVENLSKHSEDGTPKGSINGERSTKGHTGERKTERWRKLAIPIYDGESVAYGWINKLESFFQMRDILEEEKIQAVMVALEGKALSWFQWWENCNSDIGWKDGKISNLPFLKGSKLQPHSTILLPSLHLNKKKRWKSTLNNLKSLQVC